MARLINLWIFVVAFIWKYDIVESQCAGVECPSSYFDPDLVVTPDLECHPDGGTVTYTCAEPLGGPPGNTCNAGTWQFPSSTCDVWTCTPPVVGDAVTLDPDQASYGIREVVTYGCDPGYSRVGTASASCDSQDIWNPVTVPICSATCDIPNISNGGIEESGPFEEGDSATITCDSGHSLGAGATTIRCIDGSWDALPSCYPRCNITGIANSDSPSPVSLAPGESKTIDCSPGYSYNQETTFSVVCDNGVTTGEIPPACFQDCTALSPPVNGEISSESLHGETATYSCNRGYLLNVTAEVTCTDGDWSDTDTPTCHSKSLASSIVLFCNPDQFIVELPLELLEENPTINSVSLGSCSGSVLDAEYMYANSSYTDCGTTMEVDNVVRSITYRNQLSSVDNEPVTIVEELHLNIECVFDQDNAISSSSVVHNSLSQDLKEDGVYQISFGIYTDDTFSTAITEVDVIETGSDMVILAEVVDVENLDVYPIHCYATPDEIPYSTEYDLIINGCSVSPYATDLSTTEAGVTNPHLAFHSKAFRFPGSGSDAMYIHCDLRVCPFGECPIEANCVPSRRRRGISESNLVISKHVSAGPIKLHHSGLVDAESGVWQVTALTVYSATLSFLVLTVVAVVVVIKSRRAGYTPAPKTDEHI